MGKSIVLATDPSRLASLLLGHIPKRETLSKLGLLANFDGKAVTHGLFSAYTKRKGPMNITQRLTYLGLHPA